MARVIWWILVALASASAHGWTARQVAVHNGFAVPECVVVDPADGSAYVSNIEAAPNGYWADDGRAFLSKLTADGPRRWVDSSPQAPLGAPKGMAILDGVLHVADNTVVRRYRLSSGQAQPPVRDERWQRLNDMASDGTAVYVSDTATGSVYRIAGSEVQPIQGPPSVNGITFHDGHMYAVSWDLHDIYELDPSGNEGPQAFGLAEHFVNLDGVEVLGDGTFLVSDFMGNKVCAVAADRRTVTVLIRVTSPADIGLDRARGLLYVPQFTADQVAVYQLD